MFDAIPAEQMIVKWKFSPAVTSQSDDPWDSRFCIQHVCIPQNALK